MDGGFPQTVLGVTDEVLSRLLPMAATLDPSGRIRFAGPTLRRLHGGRALTGLPFTAIFSVQRPEEAATVAGLEALAGRRLTFQMHNAQKTPLRGIALALAPGQGMIINLSFGIGVADAVRDHGLTHADFAPTDLTVELLYLTEVKAAVTAELKALNLRLRDAQEKSETQALTDALTGLANRRAFDAALAKAVSGARRGQPFVLMHLDLDRFKNVNDTLGHAAGDQVITAVADVLRSQVRLEDVAARVGGDEFMLILPGLREAGQIASLARRIIGRIEAPIRCGREVARVSGSFGVSLSQHYEAPDAAVMIADADGALYASKRHGRGCCTIHGSDPATG